MMSRRYYSRGINRRGGGRIEFMEATSLDEAIESIRQINRIRKREKIAKSKARRRAKISLSPVLNDWLKSDT